MKAYRKVAKWSRKIDLRMMSHDWMMSYRWLFAELFLTKNATFHMFHQNSTS